MCTSVGPSARYGRGWRFHDRNLRPLADDERYLEIWNLVFMQNIRGEGPAKEGYPITLEMAAEHGSVRR